MATLVAPALIRLLCSAALFYAHPLRYSAVWRSEVSPYQPSSTALVLGRSDVPLCMLFWMLMCMQLCMLLCILLCMLSSLTHPIAYSCPALSCLGSRQSPVFSCSAPQLGYLPFSSFPSTSLLLCAPSFALLLRLIRFSA